MRHTAISPHPIWRFLSVVHLRDVDFDVQSGAAHSYITSPLAHVCKRNDLWPMIVPEVASYNQNAGTITHATIAADIREAFAAPIRASIAPFVCVQDAVRLFGDDAAADKYTAALAAIGGQYGRDALVIVDNAHLAERLALALHNAWRDGGQPVRLLLQGRETKTGPDHRGRQPILAELAHTALVLTVNEPDLAGVVARLLARRDNRRPLTIPDAALREWLGIFKGDLIAFSFAARGKLGNFLRGDFRLLATDAGDYVRAEYLANPDRPISDQERENLLAMAACSGMEVRVMANSLPHPGQLSVSQKHGLVWKVSFGRDAQFAECRFPHPGIWDLIWAAVKPAKTMLTCRSH
jgi:hypothetical protein